MRRVCVLFFSGFCSFVLGFGLLLFLCVCLFVCMYPRIHSGSLGGQKTVYELELELQFLVNHPVWMLGAKLRSPAGAARALSQWAFLHPFLDCFKTGAYSLAQADSHSYPFSCFRLSSDEITGIGHHTRLLVSTLTVFVYYKGFLLLHHPMCDLKLLCWSFLNIVPKQMCLCCWETRWFLSYHYKYHLYNKSIIKGQHKTTVTLYRRHYYISSSQWVCRCPLDVWILILLVLCFTLKNICSHL